MCFRRFLAPLVWWSLCLSSPAAPVRVVPSTVGPVAGDAAAVIAHCGQPTSDTASYNPTTRRMQRVLLYDHAGMALRFQPAGSSWSFTSGTLDGQVASLHTLESAFQCMKIGMAHSPAVVTPAAKESPAGAGAPGAQAHGVQTADAQAADAQGDDELLSFFGLRTLLALVALSLMTGLLVLWPPPRRLITAGRGADLLEDRY